MAALDDLLLELMDAPTDDDFLVYADAASMLGDPRGELVIIQHALRRHELSAHQRVELLTREAELLDAHDELLGPLRKVFDPSQLANGLHWRNGFLHAVRLDSCRLLRTGNLAYDVDIHDALGTVLGHPSAVLLRELVIGSDNAWETFEAELEVIEQYHPYTLKRFVINDRWADDEPDNPTCYDISWFKLAGMATLSRAVPDLEELELISGDFLDLDQLDLPRLRRLAVRTGSLRRGCLEAICARTYPCLERLELWFGQERKGADVTVEDLAPLLAGRNFPALRWLGLMNSEFTDELAEVLPDAPIVRQLDGLSLSMGCLSATGAARLVARRSEFVHLRELDVSLSLLDAYSLRSVQTLCPYVRVGRQRGDRAMRYATVGE